MEKDMEGNNINRLFFITGAESTGKSTLTDELARRFGGTGVPEFARTYLETIARPYTYNDVEIIARRQIGLIYENRQKPLVFFDTCLIILKVWFCEVFNRVPEWLENEIPMIGQGIYLLCEPDLPWQFDPLRENPHRREYLSRQYEKEIRAAGFDFFRISGSGQERVQCATEIVNRFINFDIGQK
jgi:nicotinamide riboside kinase